MKSVTISLNDLNLFRECRLKDRADWWATFSAEPNFGEIYPFITRGFTQPSQRLGLRKDFPKLAEIADLYLELRPQGGRFFIDHHGAYFHETAQGPHHQFAKFILNPVVYVPPPRQGDSTK
jgi:hypothetical protein